MEASDLAPQQIIDHALRIGEAGWPDFISHLIATEPTHDLFEALFLSATQSQDAQASKFLMHLLEETDRLWRTDVLRIYYPQYYFQTLSPELISRIYDFSTVTTLDSISQTSMGKQVPVDDYLGNTRQGRAKKRQFAHALSKDVELLARSLTSLCQEVDSSDLYAAGAEKPITKDSMEDFFQRLQSGRSKGGKGLLGDICDYLETVIRPIISMFDSVESHRQSLFRSILSMASNVVSAALQFVPDGEAERQPEWAASASRRIAVRARLRELADSVAAVATAEVKTADMNRRKENLRVLSDSVALAGQRTSRANENVHGGFTALWQPERSEPFFLARGPRSVGQGFGIVVTVLPPQVQHRKIGPKKILGNVRIRVADGDERTTKYLRELVEQRNLAIEFI